jgi:hypothetical protein
VRGIETAVKPERTESVARSFPENACAFADLDVCLAKMRRSSHTSRARAEKKILL